MDELEDWMERDWEEEFSVEGLLED